jgi:hypothetical protein
MSESNITVLQTQTSLPMPAETVLNGARKENFTTVVVLGYTQEGEEFFSASTSDAGELVLLMERFRVGLLTDRFGPLVRR